MGTTGRPLCIGRTDPGTALDLIEVVVVTERSDANYLPAWAVVRDFSTRESPRTGPGRKRVEAGLRGIPQAHRVDVQAALAMLAPEWGFGQLIDVSDEQAREHLARASVMALSFVAQSARGGGRPPVSQEVVDGGRSIPERFLIRWRGEADPAHVKAIDAYWISAAEHGMNASTFTARVVASTGADVAAALSSAVGALSGPLHGGAPSRVLTMLEEVERSGDAEGWVKRAMDRGDRLMGFGHRVYRAEDPRARVLRRTCRELGSPRFEAAEALERAALAELQARKPDRVLATNVEFWSAVVLDLAEVPADLFTPMFTCARVAGWSAHILEQKREGRLIRPTAKYVGEPARAISAVG
jgi:citrate synthase